MYDHIRLSPFLNPLLKFIGYVKENWLSNNLQKVRKTLRVLKWFWVRVRVWIFIKKTEKKKNQQKGRLLNWNLLGGA